ncbi:MAG TPA: TolC family protein, partial [Longimicrobiales bacterium]|nr:TolC family protein [Longimicrobiales bacterium]
MNGPQWLNARVAGLSGLAAGVLVTSVAGQALTPADAVEAALSRHPAVAAADARVVAAQEAGDAARAARFPGAAVSATLTRFEEPMVVAPLHSLDFASPPSFDRTLLQGRLAMQYTLFDGGALAARIRAADASHDATRFGRSDVEMQILEETLNAYVGILSARAVLEAAATQVAALGEEQARAQRQFTAGAVAQVEVMRAAA